MNIRQNGRFTFVRQLETIQNVLESKMSSQLSRHVVNVPTGRVDRPTI